LLLKARLTSPPALQELIDRATEVEVVEATMTTLALSELEGRATMTRFGPRTGEVGA
jgi:hypothetical protein